ncbi:DUF4007 family protein [Dyadobacter sp. CY261]|uniref:DUF4007 family protein n=1 Tax=Dyadobacter sp. CY261 TaxID=2907203 RepID=UPI001F405F7D|nr:DUF4007 family protein [Dyadobacter sp. CY261]MCF0075601.1 DUF4007 family protein [Dyadobacter sp. CY261]
MELAEGQYTKLTFSGHETFQCRNLWLKKGYDFLKRGCSFNDATAVVELGVGKNMVASIAYWMKAFDLLDKNSALTEFGTYLLDSDIGRDPFLEDEMSLWLLHYHLIKKNFATTFHLIFNEMRQERPEFKKEHFLAYVQMKATQLQIASTININTLSNDFDIFVKTYKTPNKNEKDPEEAFTSLLTDLHLLKSETRRSDDGFQSTIYHINHPHDANISDELLLYSIVDNETFKDSISLRSIAQETNSPGNIFAINQQELSKRLSKISRNDKLKIFELSYSENAGIAELQIKNKPNKFTILDIYYGF